MLVAVHNSHSVPLNTPQIAVPHGNLVVKQFDSDLLEMVPINGDVLCNEQEDELNPDQTIENCQLFIDKPIQAEQLSFFTIEYAIDQDLRVDVHDFESSNEEVIMETDAVSLTYNAEITTSEDGVFFDLKHKLTNSTDLIGFDLRYWQGMQDPGQQASGVYIFRPTDDQYDSRSYSQFKNIKFSKGEIASQFLLYFQGSDESPGDALVRV
jgi:hypothetical protein